MKFKLLIYYFLLFVGILGCNSKQTSTGVDESNTNIIEGCMDTSACNFDPNATSANFSSCLFETDACGICGGSSTSSNFCSSLLQIILNNQIPLGGFQFNYSGEGKLLSASGGSAEAAGFSISTGNNIVLGFSFSGSSIPIGEGTLIILEVEGAPGCIDNVILSGTEGSELEASIDCNKIIIY